MNLTEQDKKRLERIKSYCSISVLVFVGCISLLTYCTTKARVEEAKAKQEAETVIVSSKP